jgi:hypothetical protein
VPRIRAVSSFLKSTFKADRLMHASTKGPKMLDTLLETDTPVTAQTV